MNLTQEFLHLATPAWAMALFNIIMIDIVMSWDNAILIGMATRNLKWKERQIAITFWIILATVLRIVLAIFATILLQITGLQFAGAILLLYVVWKFYKELRSSEKHEEHGNSSKNKWIMYAIYTIIIADFSMSLDNVLAVSGASHGNIVTLWIWLVFSILLMAVASNAIAKSLDKYPQIQWLGLFVILFVAMEMLISGGLSLWEKVLHFNILPIATFVIWMIFIVLHQKYIKPANEEKIKTWLSKNYMQVIIWNLSVIMFLLIFWEQISQYVHHHIAILYAIFAIFLSVILELVLISKSKK